MDPDRFDTIARRLNGARSRRGALGALLGGSLGLLALSNPVARKSRGKKAKKPKNAFGCVDVGDACRGRNGACCSGICQGKKPKKGRKDKSKCVAHNAGICIAEADSCTTGVDVPCNPSNPSCFCTLTTGNAGFCAAFSGGPAGHCRDCRKDSDCEPEFGEGAACVVLGGACTPLCLATGRTACAPPCA